MLQGQLEAAIERLRPVHAGWLQRSDEAAAARVAIEIAKRCWNLDRFEAVLQWAEQARDSAERAGDRDASCVAWALIAPAEAALRQPGRAMQSIEQALRRLDDGVSPETQRLVATAATMCYGRLGLGWHALRMARRALELAVVGGELVAVFRSRFNVIHGIVSLHEQMHDIDPDAMRSLIEEGLSLREAAEREAAALGGASAQADCDHHIGNLLACAGRLEEAEALLRRSLEGPVERNSPDDMRDDWADLAWVQRRLGRSEAAEASLAEAQRWAARAVSDDSVIDLKGRLLMARAAGRFEEALALSERHHARVMQNVVLAMDARVAELNAQLAEQSLRLENLGLRERYRDMSENVQQMSAVARLDGLTGVLNRRALEAAFAEARSAARPLALAMVDLDHFKRINDRYSHGVGDAVLRRTAELLGGALRMPDQIGRYGGEEFTLLLVAAGLDAAVAAVDRLRESVQRHDWASVAPGLAVTLSAGVTVVQADESFEQAVARADEALYRAKRRGRNRVVAARHG